jgi:hypothetical protein
MRAVWICMPTTFGSLAVLPAIVGLLGTTRASPCMIAIIS